MRNENVLSIHFQEKKLNPSLKKIITTAVDRVKLPVDLYKAPVAVAAITVFNSSSVPLAHDRSTPKAEYITAIDPKVLAVALPFFIT